MTARSGRTTMTPHTHRTFRPNGQSGELVVRPPVTDKLEVCRHVSDLTLGGMWSCTLTPARHHAPSPPHSRPASFRVPCTSRIVKHSPNHLQNRATIQNPSVHACAPLHSMAKNQSVAKELYGLCVGCAFIGLMLPFRNFLIHEINLLHDPFSP